MELNRAGPLRGRKIGLKSVERRETRVESQRTAEGSHPYLTPDSCLLNPDYCPLRA